MNLGEIIAWMIDVAKRCECEEKMDGMIEAHKAALREEKSLGEA